MPAQGGFDRRSFLKHAGASALIGAVGARAAAGEIAATASTAAPGAAPAQQVFDFDEVYDRVGTNCTKWDGAIADFGEGIEVGMGIADMDFRAPPCITRALAQRCAHGARPCRKGSGKTP